MEFKKGVLMSEVRCWNTECQDFDTDCKRNCSAFDTCASLCVSFESEPNELPDEGTGDLKNPFNYQVGGSHYKKEGGMDLAEWSKRRGHCPYQYCSIKYIDRHKEKDGIKDLRKAKQYLEFIAYIEYGENL